MSDTRNPFSPAGQPDPARTIDHAADVATGNANADPSQSVWPATPEELAAAATHRAGMTMEAMPDSLARKLDAMIEAGIETGIESGIALQPIATYGDSMQKHGTLATPNFSSKRSWLPWSLAAAAVLALTTTMIVMRRSAQQREQELAAALEQLTQLKQQVAENESLLATARTELSKQKSEYAVVAQRELKLAEQLADATKKYAALEAEHSLAEIKIAKLEAPVDPAELARSRTKLLEVPGTVRLAWAPFNLEGAAPAEQPGLTGDVVWNDEQETGYLRFAGLKPNDPKVEQYQVWVIDERGMEQKVSGGVFNATAQGEVIVPIDPGIDVGKVVLFAITVEKPGGTWVPDLKRRLVVAPRGT